MQDNDKDSFISLDKITQSNDDTTEGDGVGQPEPSRCSTRIRKHTTLFDPGILLVRLETGVQIWPSTRH
eukprot:7791814-Ditylum_brightwellii.AAC.1